MIMQKLHQIYTIKVTQLRLVENHHVKPKIETN